MKDFELIQQVGYYDKEEKEPMFEKDIITDFENSGYNFIIEWNKFYLCWWVLCIDDNKHSQMLNCYLATNKVKKLGNIFENSELLKDTLAKSLKNGSRKLSNLV